MNKIIVILIISLLTYSCNNGSGNINVTINDVPDGRKVTLKKQVDGKIKNIDSTSIQNGKFSFNTKFTEPMVFGVFIDSLEQGIYPLMDVTDKVSIVAYKDSLHKSVITGSKMHSELTDLRKMRFDLSKSMSAFTKEFQEARKVNDTAKINEINAKARTIQAKISSNEWSYIKANPNSYVSPMILSGLIQDPNYKDSIKPAFDGFSEEVKNSSLAKQLKEYLEKRNIVPVAPQANKTPESTK